MSLSITLLLTAALLSQSVIAIGPPAPCETINICLYDYTSSGNPVPQCQEQGFVFVNDPDEFVTTAVWGSVNVGFGRLSSSFDKSYLNYEDACPYGGGGISVGEEDVNSVGMCAFPLPGASLPAWGTGKIEIVTPLVTLAYAVTLNCTA